MADARNPIQIERRESKAGKPYIALVLDLGYRKAVLSFNRQEIAEYLGYSVVELEHALPDKPDAVVVVGSISQKGV